jgi:hypothetical protein
LKYSVSFLTDLIQKMTALQQFVVAAKTQRIIVSLLIFITIGSISIATATELKFETTGELVATSNNGTHIFWYRIDIETGNTVLINIHTIEGQYKTITINHKTNGFIIEPFFVLFVIMLFSLALSAVSYYVSFSSPPPSVPPPLPFVLPPALFHFSLNSIVTSRSRRKLIH